MGEDLRGRKGLDGDGVSRPEWRHGSRIRAHAWDETVLGAMEAWPASLRTLVDVMLDARKPMHVAWGPERTLIYNDAYGVMLGRKHPDALGRPCLDVWSEAQDVLAPLFDRVFEGDSVHMDDIALVVERHGIREEAHFAFSYTPVRHADGSVIGLFTSCTDTTAQVRAERQKVAERDSLRELFRQTPSFMAVLGGQEHRFDLANDAFLKLIGGRDVVGLPVREALGEVDGQGFFDILDRLYSTGETFVGHGAEVRIERTAGAPPERRFLDFVYQPIRDRAGEVTGIFVAGSDVTEAWEASEELREREQRLRLIVEAATDYAILTMDTDRMVTSWSAGAAATFGYAPEEIVGLSADLLFTPEDLADDRPREEAKEALTKGVASNVRWHARKYGGRVFINGVVRLLRDASGKELGFLKIARDETDRLAAEKALQDLNETLESRVEERTRELMVAEEAMRQSQKMEAVGQLTGGVAHDFNNLLTIIRSSVDLLRRPDLPEERRRRYVDAVSDTVDRAAKLTGQLLAFARRQALQPEVFEVGARLRTVVEMLDTVTGTRIDVVTQFPDKPCFIRADVSQFETALVNMAINARDAMDGEGVLTLSLHCGVAMPPVRGHAEAPGPFAAVTLADTGRGIPEEDLTRLFEPFFTTKEVGKGTGLGLSQVFGFAKQSGGDVAVASGSGEGATFTLYLPEVDAEARDAEDGHVVEPTPDGAGLRVLVVEDNTEVGRFATQVLQDMGYETTWTANAEEALDTLGQQGAGFDVVFSDVVMPGMGGIALAKELRRRIPDLPVVLASGYSHVLAQEGTHGFDLLHKPYSAELLSNALRRAANRRR